MFKVAGEVVTSVAVLIGGDARSSVPAQAPTLEELKYPARSLINFISADSDGRTSELPYSARDISNREHLTQSFDITHQHHADFVTKIGTSAETYKKNLSELWIGADISMSVKVRVILNEDAPGKGEKTRSSANLDIGENGLRSAEVNIFGSSLDFASIGRALRHEIAHCIFAQDFASKLPANLPNRFPPRWFDEGAAMVGEGPGPSDQYFKRILLSALDTKRHIPLLELFQAEKYPEDPKRHELFYAQSKSIVEFLLEEGKHTNSTHMLLLITARDSRTIGVAEAIKRNYDLTIPQLEEKWIRWQTISPLSRLR